MARYRLSDIGSGLFTWRDLYVLVRRWQKLPGNALAASVHGAEVPSFTEQVIAIVADQLAVANWQRKGGKGIRPKRLQRWWETQKVQKFGRDPIPISEFDAWWDSKNRR